MLNYKIEKAAPKHILNIAAHMRPADRREVMAAGGLYPWDALYKSLKSAVRAWTAFIDGRPEFMWGVSASANQLIGIPWLLGTEVLESKAAFEFARQSRGYVEKMQEGFELLVNYVHAENDASLRWLKWCGFVLGEKRLVNNENFFRFWRTPSCAT